MRGARRGYRYPGGRNNNHAMLMLFLQVMRIGLTNIPPVTLLIFTLCCGLHFGALDRLIYGFHLGLVTFSGQLILWEGELWRLLTNHIFHVNDMHLVYVMGSLLWKGRAIEPAVGSVQFLWLVLMLALSASLFHLLIVLSLSTFGRADALFTQSAGFSCVLFALKVVMNYSPAVQAYSTPAIMGIRLPFQLPTKHMAWFELVLIHVLAPNTSFLGHLSGICAGLLYASGVAASIFELPNKLGINTIFFTDDMYEAMGLAPRNQPPQQEQRQQQRQQQWGGQPQRRAYMQGGHLHWE